MKYTVEVDNPIGMILNVLLPSGRKLKGKITDCIPANKKPTDAEMEKFYGFNWQDLCHSGEMQAIKYDRVLFINESDGHPIVQPMNMKSRCSDIWLEFKQ